MQEGTLDFDPHDSDLAKVASLGQVAEQRPTIPGYVLNSRIGDGSFGEVWAATQLSTGQRVAIKILHRTDLGAVSYLEREISRLVNVTEHPNLLTLIDANLTHVPAFLVTPLLGGSLEKYTGSPVSVPQVVRWMHDVATALAFIHGRGILHCDLKPSNLLQDQEDRIRVVDFGQAHLLEQTGSSLGTLWFMPAEQVPALRTAPHPEVTWDIYAFGATFYDLLTGRPPRQTPEADKLIREQSDARGQLEEYRRLLKSNALQPIRQRNPSVDRDLEAIVQRCLESNADERYPSALELLADLGRRQRGYPVRARKATFGYLARRLLARNWALVATALVTLAALGVSFWQLQESRQQLSRIQAQAQLTEATFLASNGSVQPLARLAQASVYQPDNLAVRLLFENLLPLQWVRERQFMGTGNQGLVTHDRFFVIYVNNTAPGTVEAFDCATGTSKLRYEHHAELNRCSASQDSRWLLCPGQDGRVARWNLRNGASTIVTTHKSPVGRALFDDSAQHCLSGSDDGEVHWTQCDDGASKLQWRHKQAVTALALSGEGRYGASASADGTVQLWDLHDMRLLSQFQHSSAVVDLAWLDSTKTLLVGCAEGRIETHSLASASSTSWLHGTRLTGLKATGGSILSWGGGSCRIWSPGGKLVQEFPQTTPVSCCDINPKGSLLITGSQDGMVKVWDVKSGNLAYTPLSRPGWIHDVSFFPGDDRLLICHSALDLWTLKEVQRLPTSLPHQGPVKALAWHPKGEWLATLEGSTVALWTPQGESLGRPFPLPSRGVSLRADAEGRLFCQTSDQLLRFEVDGRGKMEQLDRIPLVGPLSLSREGHWGAQFQGGSSVIEVFPLQKSDSSQSWRYHLEGGVPIMALPADDGQSLAVVIQDPGGPHLALVGRDGQNKATPTVIQNPLLLRFNREGDLLCVSERASTLFGADLQPKWSRPRLSSPVVDPVGQAIPAGWWGANCDPAVENLVTFNVAQAEWVDARTGKLIRRLPVMGRLREGTFSSDGSWLCLVGSQGAYLYRPSQDGGLVPLSEPRMCQWARFTPGKEEIILSRGSQPTLYPLAVAPISPEQLKTRAASRSGVVLVGDTEQGVAATWLNTLRDRARPTPQATQGKTGP